MEAGSTILRRYAFVFSSEGNGGGGNVQLGASCGIDEETSRNIMGKGVWERFGSGRGIVGRLKKKFQICTRYIPQRRGGVLISF